MSSAEMNELIDAYARAKWGAPPDSDAVARLGAQLEPALKQRLDVLGSDGERLLEAGPDGILDRLAELEEEAFLEDAAADPAADRRRTLEESKFANRLDHQRGDNRVRAREHHRAARNGRHRQRG